MDNDPNAIQEVIPPKEIVVIHLDSDTEDDSEEIEEIPVPPKEIAVIQIDSDTEDEATPEKVPDNKTAPIQICTSAKKIDYLNLEDSELNIEPKNCGTNTLMESASKLNDIPCGPIKKPTDVLSAKNISFENVPLPKQVEKTVTAKFVTDFNSSRNTPDIMQDSTEDSHLDTCDKESVEAFPLINNTSGTSCTSREDNRVIEASQNIVACRIPRQINHTYNAHEKLITSLSWCIPKFSCLFLSASQDGSIKIWDLNRTNFVQVITAMSGLNAAKWSLDGGQIVAGGFEKKAFVYDVQTGRQIVHYDIYNVIYCLECYPYMEDVYIFGTKNAILGFDVRVNTSLPIRSFFSECEEVLDIAFLDEKEFICSTNIVSQDSSNSTIMAWDFGSGAMLSNHTYLERYTCPSLKVHPSGSSFIANSSGNYITKFSRNQPNKVTEKRYTGHKVAGYGIECDISPDGKYVVSGDVDGSLYFYNYSTTSTAFVTPKRKVPTNRVRWNPVLSSTLICSTYDGQIQIWK